MHHHCPYYHNDEFIPAELREILEDHLYSFFSAEDTGNTSDTGPKIHAAPTHHPVDATTGSSAGPGEAENAGSRRRTGSAATAIEPPGANAAGTPAAPAGAEALGDMVENICRLATPVLEYSGGRPELSQRLAHDMIHRIGELFAVSNEGRAVEALAALRRRIDGLSGEARLKALAGVGLGSDRAELLRARRAEAVGVRAQAWELSLQREVERVLDEYQGRLHRSIIRSNLPAVVGDLIRDSRELSEVADKMEYYFGISSGMWDLKKGDWRSIPWDIFRKGRELLDSDPSVRRLADILGRGPGVRAGDQKAEKQVETLREEKISSREFLGRSEILGVEYGDDINILLPGEYAFLMDPDTEARFFKELLDGELLISRFRSDELRVRTRTVKDVKTLHYDRPLGPLVLCIDTSGSMAGWPEQIAKALSMALIGRCWEQKRKLYAILFSTEVRELDLSDLNESISEFSGFFSMEFRGGTDLRPALRASIRKMNEGDFRNADLLIVSDFRVPKIMIKQSRALEETRRRGGNRIHALTIGQQPIIDSFNMFDSQWHYRLSGKDIPLGVTGLVEI